MNVCTYICKEYVLWHDWVPDVQEKTNPHTCKHAYTHANILHRCTKKPKKNSNKKDQKGKKNGTDQQNSNKDAATPSTEATQEAKETQNQNQMHESIPKTNTAEWNEWGRGGLSAEL
jgi:hypothetical protein